jgi:two-component system CheB/CheR fusion protein
VEFPIVGIGASAGGLEAFTQLLGYLPGKTGFAYVLIQHLDPTHKSFLSESLAKATSMPVEQVQPGQLVEPDHVYVIPPAADVSIANGRLVLVPRGSAKLQLHLPVDFFFTALAAELRNRAIGVVLSGTASDGTEGLRAIQAAGGITFAQEPETAKFAGMPRSAVAAGVVDVVLPIAGLARELLRLGQHPYLLDDRAPLGGGGEPSPAAGDGNASWPPARDGQTGEGQTGDSQPSDSQPSDSQPGDSQPGKLPSHATALVEIMNVVRSVVGVDFREYKGPTFERRLARRMALRRVDDRLSYLALLRNEPDEVRALYEDTLIHVSSFFRDPDVFDTLKTAVFPVILAHKDEGSPIRIWVAGCSTGQEVYSLAIALLEFLGDSRRPIQLFGSDVSEAAIQLARAGRYADGGMGGISEEQRRRFFTKMDAGYRINRNVRDLCVFVRHDLARDPPFPKVDLLSCRNVLIYFDQALQQRVLPAFHYSLNQPGFLLLGRTESISGFDALFSPLDKIRKIFTRTTLPSHLRFAPRHEVPAALPLRMSTTTGPGFGRADSEMGRRLDSLLLGYYAPPGVLVNQQFEVLQFRGQTGSYLQPASGSPQTNLLKMARPGLLSKLQDALKQAGELAAPVRIAGVEVDQDGFTRTCDLVVLPFGDLAAGRTPESTERLFVVLFEEVPPPEGDDAEHDLHRVHRRGRGPDDDPGRLSKLEHELTSTTQYLHALIEEHGRANEDLGSANEELLSGNEELQSLNEELETAKEELQSTNEELTTVNDELHRRNLEVGQINSDLANLLDTVDLAIVILDLRRHIRRFTPKAQALLSVLPSDIGRSFDDIKPKLDLPDLDRRISEVISTFVAQEEEVQDRSGRWYRMQIRPYRTPDHRIDGAIVSFFDIDALKHHLLEAHQAQEQAERADRAKDEFLAVLSHELRTPISALLMQSELLRRVGGDPAKRARVCDAIERSTRIQVQLIDDLLDVSRIITGKMRVDLRPLDLAAVVEAAHLSVAAMAESKGIQLTASLDRSLDPISGDRNRLEQVVANLLTNSIKFTPKGGRISILLERIPGGPGGTGQAHLEISDNGIGIDAAFLPRIFNRLTQEDSSSTRSHTGLGLGLAIVRYLVEAHGGLVRAESGGVGRGATFHVALPLLDVLATSGQQGPGRSPSKLLPEMAGSVLLPPALPAKVGRLAGRRILVVEDDALIRDSVAEILEHAGAQVTKAASAAEGVALFVGSPPDGIVCDLAMPREDGYGFIRKVRGLDSPEGRRVPAMALTALPGERHRERALSLGFQSYVVKPVGADQLLDAVAGLLGLG